jgi:hypothetical protein
LGLIVKSPRTLTAIVTLWDENPLVAFTVTT